MRELIWKEGVIMTSRVSHGEFAETIDNMNRGTLKPDAIVTDIMVPSEAQHAFEMLEEEPQKHLKIMLKFQE
jgi:threonine dehydrogenase-like Zn-dependent dehydrogenase